MERPRVQQRTVLRHRRVLWRCGPRRESIGPRRAVVRLVHPGSHPGDHVQTADLIIALAPEHAEWIRRNFPEVAHRTATLKRLSRDLSHEGDLAQRLDALDLENATLEPWEEVIDPGGGEVQEFINCASEVLRLCDELCSLL